MLRLASGVPLTVTATASLLDVVEPLPSCPEVFRPQHASALLLARAHVWAAPASMALMVRPESAVPETVTAVGVSTFAAELELLPKRPSVCKPQQARVPSLANAQVCAAPVVTAEIVFPDNGVDAVVTAVGTR